MEIDPYSIYVDHRPLKVAFLADPSDDFGWIDRIVEYNREKWGGRYNPIFLTNGDSIDDAQWQLLRDYDPDVIKSTVVLGQDFQRRIRVFLSPLSVELHEEGSDRLSLRNDPISLLPTRQLISQIARGFSDDQSALVLFDLADDAPPAIQHFIKRNFGVIDPERQVYHIKRALDELRTSVFKISDIASLNEALSQIGDYRRVVFPSQLCTLPNFLRDARSDRTGENFGVIVGDSSQDLAYAWNRTLAIPQWLRTGLTQLWLPEELAREPAFKPGLTRFLNRFADTTGNQGQRGLHIVSFSLSEDALRNISETWGNGLWVPRTFRALSTHPVPAPEETDSFFIKKGLQLYRAHSNEEHLVLTEPNVSEGSTGGQHWVVDVAIQFRPERFASIRGKDYWWRLPNRNNLLSETHFLNRPARIRADRGLSVLMTRQSALFSDGNTLVVKPPDDFTIAYALFCGERFDHLADNHENRAPSRPYHAIEHSDKGKYLSGVLSLFPDLLNAYSLFEERFWRMTFARMANQSDRKDALKKIEIVNTLKKHLPDWEDLATDEEVLAWWAERVLTIAKDYSKEERDLPYVELFDDAVAETNAYNALHSEHPPFQVDQEDFKQTVSDLLSSNVLLQGIRPKCPRCGYRIWYHLDRASQNMPCEGCGYPFTVATEEGWSYRLNSLVRAAVSSHGTVPLLLVLGQLMRDARTAFMFVPCLNLFRHETDGSEKYRHVGELDLVCIVDGRFTIGEVKNSIALFKKSDFDALASIAKEIKPDVVLFSALDGSPTRFVQNNIERIRKELEPLEIDVNWYALHHWITEPRPVR